jgi:hypothetical protein
VAQRIDSFSESGSFFAGLQAGYNYVLPNRLLIGAEVDATFPAFQNLAGLSIGNFTNLTSPTLGAEIFGENVLASETVRGRVGYAPGSWLFYATGGFAWTYNQQSLTQVGHRQHRNAVPLATGLGGRRRRRSTDHAALDGSARISVYRLCQKHQHVLRWSPDNQFRFYSAGVAARLELSVRLRSNGGERSLGHQSAGDARSG